MPQRILNEDWNEYDNRKIRDKRDAKFFSCEEKWEVDYLVAKIKKHKSNPEQEIRNAIAACCKTVSAPRPRKQFVECVMSKL
ncbi:hypothetical protein GCM10022289_23590 [Pedobacter jeongneungensis]|uniref:Uncharacterized protein n=1 Tax=Pedobacter jeongneungensis TaxID=947309 RepID=A0ABP8BEE6_9SPHI